VNSPLEQEYMELALKAVRRCDVLVVLLPAWVSVKQLQGLCKTVRTW
jgi:hypothetical protein